MSRSRGERIERTPRDRHGGYAACVCGHIYSVIRELALRPGILEQRFRFAEHGTTLARDSLAGMTTFIVMSYIIFLNRPSSASRASRAWRARVFRSTAC
jgi:hypothetical protein